LETPILSSVATIAMQLSGLGNQNFCFALVIIIQSAPKGRAYT
jgi:hypothetical protein